MTKLAKMRIFYGLVDVNLVLFLPFSYTITIPTPMVCACRRLYMSQGLS